MLTLAALDSPHMSTYSKFYPAQDLEWTNGWTASEPIGTTESFIVASFKRTPLGDGAVHESFITSRSGRSVGDGKGFLVEQVTCRESLF